MNFERGDTVQAVDELGRWEEATIKDICGGRYLVKFVGWRDLYNRLVEPTQVRERQEPLNGSGKLFLL